MESKLREKLDSMSIEEIKELALKTLIAREKSKERVKKHRENKGGSKNGKKI